MLRVFFNNLKSLCPSAALFLSGSGTNAEKLLESCCGKSSAASWKVSVLVTDRPETSAARQLSARFDVPLVEHDLASFYRLHGEGKTSIHTERGMRIRELWTDALRKKLEPYRIDFGLLAGFIPLTNLVSDFPCLNVHPGDLTFEENGVRCLAGLHRLPVERALLFGHRTLRSSVIMVQPFSKGASEMDSGPIPGVSAPVVVDWMGTTPEELGRVFAERDGKSSADISSDLLAQVARHNLERLKVSGDWVVFPRVVEDFASNRFALDSAGQLCYRMKKDGEFQRVRSVEYALDAAPKPLLRD